MHRMFGWDVFTDRDERVYHLPSRLIFTDRDERVYQLPSRLIFAAWGERVCELPSRRVLGRIWSDKCECVCAMPGGGVLERNRSERVCVMPDWIKLFHTRIHIHHKLRLQRRVLRTERERVCAMPGPIVL